MSSKGVSAIGMIVVFAILAIFLVIFLIAFFGPRQLLDKAADLGDNLAEKYLNKDSGLSSSSEVGIRDTFLDICSRFNSNFSVLNSDCLVSYSGMPHLKDGNLVFRQDGNNTVVEMHDETGKQSSSCVIGRKKLCVVGGTKGGMDKVVENFEINFLIGKSVPDNARKTPYTNEIKSMIVTEDGGVSRGAEVDLEFSGGKTGNLYELDDSGLLFMQDKDHLCFLMTQDTGWGCSIACGNLPDENWCLDNDCVAKMAKGGYSSLKFCR